MGILKGNQGNEKIPLGPFGKLLVFCDDFLEAVLSNGVRIAALFKSDTEDLFGFHFMRNIVRVNLDDIVATLFLCFEDGKSLVIVAWSNDAI